MFDPPPDVAAKAMAQRSGAIMTKETNRREFVQVAGLAASGLMATAGSLAAAEARPTATTMGARFRELMMDRSR